MQKQLKQLSDWLKEEEVKGQGSEDDDVINVRQEVTEVSHRPFLIFLRYF